MELFRSHEQRILGVDVCSFRCQESVGRCTDFCEEVGGDSCKIISH